MSDNRRFVIEGPDNFSMSINSLLEVTDFSVFVRRPESLDNDPLAWKDFFLTVLFRFGQMLSGSYLWDEEPELPSPEEYWKRKSMIQLKSISTTLRVPLSHYAAMFHNYVTLYPLSRTPITLPERNEYLVHFLPYINKRPGFWLNGTCRMSFENAMNMILDVRVLRGDRLIFNHAPCMNTYK